VPFCHAPTQPLKWFKTGPEIIRLAVMMYVRFPLSLRNVEDLLHERGVEFSHESVRYWWHRFRPMFAAEIRKRRIESMKSSHWRWHLDEMLVKIDVSGTTSGAPSITRARYWKASSRRPGTKRRR
jgi:transposase-like protein